MKKILVPTDFSQYAKNALDYAIHIANVFNSEITLLHTYHPKRTTGMLISLEKYLKEDAEQDMAKLIAEIKPKLLSKAPIVKKIIRGEAISQISDMADKSEYDLIVMGTQGTTGLKEIFIGSTTKGVLKKSETAVLAIPNGFSFRPINNVVFAIDQQEVSAPKVIAPLKAIVQKCDAKLMLFHLIRGEQEDLDPKLSMFLEGIDASFHFEMGKEDINESINQFVADYGADMICMIRRKRSRLEQFFHLSATTKEVFDSPVPLLVLHDVEHASVS